MNRKLYISITLYSIVLQLFACNSQENLEEKVSTGLIKPYMSQYDNDLYQKIEDMRLTGVPASKDMSTDINSPKAQLGKKLFYSKALSGNMDTACVSCHHPLLGGGDNLSLSIGTGAKYPDLLGIGRTLKDKNKQVQVPRNAPTTLNVFVYKKVMFHDGRIERLDEAGAITTPDVEYPKVDVLAGKDIVQAQSRFPLTSHAEMKGLSFSAEYGNQTTRQHLAQRLGGYGQGKGELTSLENQYWLNEFRKAFNATDLPASELITEQNISEAISEYERSQVFINNAWSKYIQGDKQALTEQQKQGALLFFTPVMQGGAGCFVCHQGDSFTDEKFYNTAMPQIGLGKGDGDTLSHDFGRMRVTGKEEDRYRFRTPSLLNVELTGPWGHDGAYSNLFDIVKHMLNPEEALKNYNIGVLTQGNLHTLDWKENTDKALAKGVALVSQEVNKEKVEALVSFLRALTDPCTKDRKCLEPWLDDAEDDPMRLQLHATKQSGERL